MKRVVVILAAQLCKIVVQRMLLGDNLGVFAPWCSWAELWLGWRAWFLHIGTGIFDFQVSVGTSLVFTVAKERLTRMTTWGRLSWLVLARTLDLVCECCLDLLWAGSSCTCSLRRMYCACILLLLVCLVLTMRRRNVKIVPTMLLPLHDLIGLQPVEIKSKLGSVEQVICGTTSSLAKYTMVHFLSPKLRMKLAALKKLSILKKWDARGLVSSH